MLSTEQYIQLILGFAGPFLGAGFGAWLAYFYGRKHQVELDRRVEEKAKSVLESSHLEALRYAYISLGTHLSFLIELKQNYYEVFKANPADLTQRPSVAKPISIEYEKLAFILDSKDKNIIFKINLAESTYLMCFKTINMRYEISERLFRASKVNKDIKDLSEINFSRHDKCPIVFDFDNNSFDFANSTHKDFYKLHILAFSFIDNIDKAIHRFQDAMISLNNYAIKERGFDFEIKFEMLPSK